MIRTAMLSPLGGLAIVLANVLFVCPAVAQGGGEGPKEPVRGPAAGGFHYSYPGGRGFVQVGPGPRFGVGPGPGVSWGYSYGPGFGAYRAYSQWALPFGSGYTGAFYGGGANPYYGYYSYASPQRFNAGRIDPGTAGVDHSPGGTGEFEQSAREAFRRGDYQEAARLVNHALIDDPQNAQLYLFASQALFAVGEYEGSAALVHQAATQLETAELGVVVQNYGQYYRGRDYIEQMNQLIEFIQQNPDSTAALFVRGFQYGFLGHRDAALKDLAKAYELESRDELVPKLIEEFGGQPPTNPAANETAPPTEFAPPETLPETLPSPSE